mmetsp:Transcript_5957/g.20977  ORF Transcript_5957/g.20977 Transcript_5957/m.20977 type:complete len:86 (-) Transcript_5957:2024-2281(-)
MLLQGESNFPALDANVNSPGGLTRMSTMDMLTSGCLTDGVLLGYKDQPGVGEAMADFLSDPVGEHGESSASSTSVNGWLTDNSAY